MYLFSRIGHLKKIILKGRGFRCVSDEKMMRMWFGLEIDVVGLPPLVTLAMITLFYYKCGKFSHENSHHSFLIVLNQNSRQKFSSIFSHNGGPFGDL